MKAAKKLWVVMALVFLAAALFQGCGKESESSKAAASSTQMQSTAAKDNPGTKAADAQASNEISSAWEKVNELEIKQQSNYLGFLNQSFGITVGPSGEVHYTTDGGKTWPQGQNESMCRFGLDILNENVAWNCGNGGTVRMTKDGGKTWQPVTDYGDSEPLQCRFLSFIDEKTGWIAEPSRMAFTKNGGMQWTEGKLPEGVDGIAAISLRTQNDGYLLDTSGVMHVTADGGKTWAKLDLGLPSLNLRDGAIPEIDLPYAAIHFSDAEHGTVIISAVDQERGKTWSFETTDGGKTWKKELLQLGKDYQLTSVYLSKDGKFLSLANSDAKVMVLKKKN